MKVSFGEQVAIERKRQELKQDELAAKAEISRTQLSHIENGSDTKLSTILRIAYALGVEIVLTGRNND